MGGLYKRLASKITDMFSDSRLSLEEVERVAWYVAQDSTNDMLHKIEYFGSMVSTHADRQIRGEADV
jgi:hypothetical protein